MAQRGVDYWTTEDQPFIDKNGFFSGIGSMARGLFVPREADLQRFPRFTTDPRVNIPVSRNRPSEKQKQKRIAAAAKKAAAARSKLDLELETSQVGQMMKLQDQDARYARARDLGLAGSNAPVGSGARPIVVRPPFVGADIQGAQPPPPPGYALPGHPLNSLAGQTALGGANMGHPLVDPRDQAAAGLANQDEMQARLNAAQAPVTLPPDRQMPGGGRPFADSLAPSLLQDQAAATLANQDAVNPAMRLGPPDPSRAGIAALMGANTGQPFIPHGLAGQTALGGANTGENVRPNPLLQKSDYAQAGLVPEGDTYNGLMPYMTDQRIGGPQGLGPEYFTSGPEDMFRNPEGGDPNSASNRLYNYIAGRDEEGGPTGLGQDLTEAGDKAQDWLSHAVTKSGEKLEHYFTPQGPYGSGGTPAGEDLSWAGDKIQQFMDYMGTVPVPGVLRDPVGTIGGLIPEGKDKEKAKLPPDFDLSLLDEEEPPEGGGDTTKGGTTKGGATAPLDDAMEKYLAATDTTYDDALATINKAYSGLEAKGNPKQDAADAYAAREGERTAALAQLAMAGGLIKSAGKSWEDAGQGVTDAAGVYSQGFDRYHRALIDSANRFDERQKGDRALELSKRDAALSMWTSGQTDRRALIKELFTQTREDKKADALAAREERKFTKEGIDKRFESEAKVRFPTDGGAEAPTEEVMSNFYDRWALSNKLGRPVTEAEFEARKARAAAKAAAKEERIHVDLTGG